MSNDKPRPLEGLTVIDLTRALAGPYATLLLAGLGARVIKVEEPREGDGRETAPFMGRDGVSLRRQHADDMPIANIVRLRGKQSITLNFKHPQAQAIFADLVRQADIVVENFLRWDRGAPWRRLFRRSSRQPAHHLLLDQRLRPARFRRQSHGQHHPGVERHHAGDWWSARIRPSESAFPPPIR